MSLKMFLTIFTACVSGVMLAKGVHGWWLVAGIGLYCLYTDGKR